MDQPFQPTMHLPTTVEEIAVKKACDEIVHKIMIASTELELNQDPSSVITRMEAYAVRLNTY